MGILDHQRTWRFLVTAAPNECTAAFHRGLTARVILGVLKCKWKTQSGRSGDGNPMVVAVYGGRAGIGAFFTSLSKNAIAEEDNALGSKLNFELSGVDEEGRTVCDMWMSLVTKQGFGTTSDARFFRAYMKAVERSLRQIDPNVLVAKA